MLWDSRNFGRIHWRWMLGTIAIAVACGVVYGIAAFGQPRWPGGGSIVGLTLGSAAGLIFVFEFLLWPRKSRWLRTARWLGKTQTWMHAHLWLGLLTLPLVVMHSGFAFGGLFTIALVTLYGLVFASGVLGLVLQNFLPRLMLNLVPQETVASQLDVVAQQLVIDARRMLKLYVDDIEDDQAAGHFESANGDDDAHPAGLKRHAIGAPRRVGTVLPVMLHPAQTMQRAAPSPEVRQAVVEVIEPFLLLGRDDRQLLATQQGQTQYFTSLRRVAPPELRDVVAALAELCERRRQLALQERLHWWLHSWLMIHLPLSAALMVLLVGHVILALRYN